MSKSIEVNMTWANFGNIYASLAESGGEREALIGLRQDFINAMSAADGLQAIQKSLTEEQWTLAKHSINVSKHTMCGLLQTHNKEIV